MRRWLLVLLGALALAAGVPRRVVSQTVGTDELLLALAEPAQVAALSHISRDAEFSAVAEAARAFPQLTGKDAEDILKYHPDLVLVSNYSRSELVAQVRRAGVRVLSLDRFNTLEDVYANLRLLGQALGRADRAEALIKACQARVEALAQRLRGAPPVRVIAPSPYGLLGGRDTTFQDLCDHAGALNVAAEQGLVGHAPTPTERILTWKVDAFVLSGKSPADALAKVRQLAPFKFMRPALEGRVALVDGPLMASVTHHRIAAYEQLARQLHPERFTPHSHSK